jgi:hypothetical protein
MRICIKVDASQLQLLNCLDVKLEQLAFIVRRINGMEGYRVLSMCSGLQAPSGEPAVESRETVSRAYFIWITEFGELASHVLMAFDGHYYTLCVPAAPACCPLLEQPRSSNSSWCLMASAVIAFAMQFTM